MLAPTTPTARSKPRYHAYSTVRTAYEILGVNPTTNTAEIRRAYRDLARRMHPDQAGDQPEQHEAFLELKAAYEVLADPDKRRAYDRDPTAVFETQLAKEQLRARIRRRRRRLMRLYD